MSDWLINTVKFTGPKVIIEKLGKSKLILNKIFPFPQSFKKLENLANNKLNTNGKKLRKELIKIYGTDKLIDWCMVNWGTQSDLVVHNIIIEPLQTKNNDLLTLIAEFESVWTPPATAFETIFYKYKNFGLHVEHEYIDQSPVPTFLGKTFDVNGVYKKQHFEFSSIKELKLIVKKLNHSLGRIELVESSRKSKIKIIKKGV